jgi:hypothetical protein
LRGGAWCKQQHIARIERDAKRLRFFQPATISGLLQTPHFTRQIYEMSLSGIELERSMAALAERQQVLQDRRKRFYFILTEGALRWRLCTDEVLAAQVRLIAALATRPKLRIGGIPFTAASARHRCTASSSLTSGWSPSAWKRSPSPSPTAETSSTTCGCSRRWTKPPSSGIAAVEILEDIASATKRCCKSSTGRESVSGHEVQAFGRKN